MAACIHERMQAAVSFAPKVSYNPPAMENNLPATTPPVRTPLAPRLVAIFAMCVAVLLAAVLGVRTISSPDIGYHLAYGEEFLDHGRIVDHNDFIYTLPDPTLADRRNLSPGSWYDREGHYRFPNANWLSQVIMAAVHRWFGPVGLSVLQAAMVLAVFLLITVIMLKLGVPPLLAGAGVLLAAMTAYDRFNLRPEMFGYTVLAAQLYLLVVAKLRWRVAAAMVVLQLLLVNLHSYFLLGLVLTGAAFIDRVVMAIWPKKNVPAAEAPDYRRQANMLAFVLVAQIVVCFINPWTWRLAMLPVDTLLFMQKHHIAGDPATATHPWSYIGEMYRPFAPGAFLEFKSTQAYRILLAAAALGFVLSLLKKRFAFALIIAAMTAVSLSMRRNIGVAAIVITPLALAASWQFLAPVIGQTQFRMRNAAIAAAGLVLAAVCGWFTLSVVDQRFYYEEQSPYRFGTGFSRLNLPLDMTQWLTEHKPKGRIWADWDASCSVHYFTSPRPDVPALTNIWAYPPSVMKEMMDFDYAVRPFDEAVKKYSLEIAALRVGRGTIKLVEELSRDSKWAVVYIDGMHVLFLRRGGQNDGLIDECEITEANLKTAKLIDHLRTTDPVPAHALYSCGLTLDRLGWLTAAVEVFEAAVKEDPESYRAWNMLGVCLAKRGIIKVCVKDPGHVRDFKAARDAFSKALEINPGYTEAARHLQEAEMDISNPSRHLPKQ